MAPLWFYRIRLMLKLSKPGSKITRCLPNIEPIVLTSCCFFFKPSNLWNKKWHSALTISLMHRKSNVFKTTLSGISIIWSMWKLQLCSNDKKCMKSPTAQSRWEYILEWIWTQPKGQNNFLMYQWKCRVPPEDRHIYSYIFCLRHQLFYKIKQLLKQRPTIL